LAFLANYQEFVYAIPTLLIPSVSGNQDTPEKFLDRRPVALYVYVNWITRADLNVDWADKSFTQDWGKVNLIFKQDYVEKLARAKSKTAEEIEAKTLDHFFFTLKEFIWTGILQKVFHLV